MDVGYRGRPLPAYLGHGAMEKHEIGVRFGELAAGSGLRLDLATGEGDRLYGDDWYRFLANCRCVLGVESGRLLLRPRGRGVRRVARAQRPTGGRSASRT